MEAKEVGTTGENATPPAPPHVVAPTPAAPPPPPPEKTNESSSVAAPPVATPTPTPPPTQQAPAPVATQPPGVVGPPAVLGSSLGLKKKRGRPRKYGPDGSLIRPLNATPISASVPTGGAEYTPAAHVGAAMKRGRARPLDFSSRQQYSSGGGGGGRGGGISGGSGGFRLEGLGLGDAAAAVALSAGATFTPHVITVAPGEDVTMKIISFSQQGPRAICILSANGVISNVTLRQPDSSGGTLTYEGRFELLSLSGSFMPTENGGTRSRSGGMSVSLASPDGRVVGGGVAGLLVAASPIQIVVGSFLPSYQMEQKPKKLKTDTVSVSTIHSSAVPISTMPISTVEFHEPYRSSAPKVTNLSFGTETWATPLQQIPPDSRNSASDVKITVTSV
ncbi:AT-hook motif nuclear-localized protein 1 [Rhynchospora pubera]|uniref:AT-hook motif nuclear-localized protein n=1 Tax=Rhynchospora pubera TaxID=906938 RepID=A0AAV8E8J9_9POAL|nr:AT-hook motif nuclear-localized protein 1 [Rhynchospora pubera]